MPKYIFVLAALIALLVAGCGELVTVTGPETSTPAPAAPLAPSQEEAAPAVEEPSQESSPPLRDNPAPAGNAEEAETKAEVVPATNAEDSSTATPVVVEAASVALNDNPGHRVIVRWSDIDAVLAETEEASDVFAALVEEFWPFMVSLSPEQIENGLILEGEGLLFIELYYLGQELPEGVQWLCDSCHEFGWGLIAIDEGVEYQIPWDEDAPIAGAWYLPIGLALERVQDTWLVTTYDQRALPLVSEDAVRSELGTLANTEQAISHMNNSYWQSALGWTASDADSGYTVVGPAFVWTAWHGSQPSGVVSACANCVRQDWGVFYVPDGVSFETPDNNSGGRWLPLWGSSCQGASRIQQFISSAETPQDAVGRMHGDLWSPVEDYDGYNRTENFVFGGVLDLAADEVAVIWTDWKGAPPEGAMPATSSSYDFGYGVFTAAGPWEYRFSDGGGGAFVFSCD